MEKISTEQIAFVIVMAVLLMFVLPIVQSRTGKSLSELLFGVGRKKKQDGADGAPKKSAGREPRMNNGTRNDLTVFVSQLLKTANKNGMGVVAPGLVEYKGPGGAQRRDRYLLPGVWRRRHARGKGRAMEAAYEWPGHNIPQSPGGLQRTV